MELLTDAGCCTCPGVCESSALLVATPWTVARQAPLPMGFPRQEYWSRLPLPPPRDLPNPGIKLECLASPALAADSLPLRHLGSPAFVYLCISLALGKTG